MVNPSEHELPVDRPLECGECKRPIAVRYTEIVGDTITHTIMCADCPVLQKKLFGLTAAQIYSLPEGAQLACGNCGTNIEAVRVGTHLGCNVCYDVFEEVILTELQNVKKVPPRINLNKKSSPIHIGRAPGEVRDINPASRLLALNEALTETLKKEDYEQAAWLRDQIKAITDENLEDKK